MLWLMLISRRVKTNNQSTKPSTCSICHTLLHAFLSAFLFYKINGEAEDKVTLTRKEGKANPYKNLYSIHFTTLTYTLTHNSGIHALIPWSQFHLYFHTSISFIVVSGVVDIFEMVKTYSLIIELEFILLRLTI